MKRKFRFCIVFIAAIATLLPGMTASAQSSDYTGSLYIEDYEMNLDFTISGGTILTAQGVEDHTDCQLTGTVRPGDTITVSGEGKAMPKGDNYMVEVLPSTLHASITCSPNSSTYPPGKSEIELEPGDSGSAFVTLPVTEEMDTIKVYIYLLCPWRTNWSGSSADLTVRAVFEVEQPEPTPIPVAPIETQAPSPPIPSPDSPVVSTVFPSAAPYIPAEPADGLLQDVPVITPTADTTAGWAAAAAAISLVSALIAAIYCAAGPAGTSGAAGGVPGPGGPYSDTKNKAYKTTEEIIKKTEPAVSKLETIDSFFSVIEAEDRLNKIIDTSEKGTNMIKRMWTYTNAVEPLDDAKKVHYAKNLVSYAKSAQLAARMKSAYDAFQNVMTVIGIGKDAWENIQNVDIEGGRLIEGDGWLKATGKSVAVNLIMGKILENNPPVAVMEAATSLLAGGTEAGDIISPVTTMKGAFNLVIDTIHGEATGSDIALKRANAGVYGPNIQNLSRGMELGFEAAKDPKRFLKEFGDVVIDKEFYKNMYDTAGTMWRTEDGTQTWAGTVAEPATQMGVAIAETVSQMAHAAGTVTEYGIHKLRNYFSW